MAAHTAVDALDARVVGTADIVLIRTRVDHVHDVLIAPQAIHYRPKRLIELVLAEHRIIVLHDDREADLQCVNEADVTAVVIAIRHHVFADDIDAEIRQVIRLDLQRPALARLERSKVRRRHERVEEHVADDERIAGDLGDAHDGNDVSTLRILSVVSPPPLVAASVTSYSPHAGPPSASAGIVMRSSCMGTTANSASRTSIIVCWSE